jgi:hypothetical protein
MSSIPARSWQWTAIAASGKMNNVRRGAPPRHDPLDIEDPSA